MRTKDDETVPPVSSSTSHRMAEASNGPLWGDVECSYKLTFSALVPSTLRGKISTARSVVSGRARRQCAHGQDGVLMDNLHSTDRRFITLIPLSPK